jgi:hypothetical protein
MGTKWFNLEGANPITTGITILENLAAFRYPNVTSIRGASDFFQSLQTALLHPS